MERTRVACVVGAVGLWLAMASMGLSAETGKVAVMDQQVVIEQSKTGKRALEELKAYSSTRQKIINADDVDQFAQVALHLGDVCVRAIHHDGHAREFGRLRVAHGQALDVEVAAAEHARHTHQDARLIFDECDECVFHGLLHFSEQ